MAPLKRKGPKPTDWSKVKFRTCTKCHKRLAIKHFYWSRGIPFSWCKECEKKRVKKWQKRNKRLVDTYQKRSQIKLRQQILDAYGNKCACCGENTPEFLTVDHVNNDGKAHRQELGAKMFYTWLRQQGFPKEGFQLLCYNCNMAKAHYGRCPHEDQK